MTAINNDQQLSTLVASGVPSVAVDQEVSLVVAPQSGISVAVDQGLALLVAPQNGISVADDQSLLLLFEQTSIPQITYTYFDQQLALLVVRNTCFQTIITGTFTDATGAPIVNGYLTLDLNHAAASCNGGQVTKQTVKITLDQNGSIPSQTYLWSTATLHSTIASLYYTLKVYKQNGQFISQEEVTIPLVPVYSLT